MRLARSENALEDEGDVKSRYCVVASSGEVI